MMKQEAKTNISLLKIENRSNNSNNSNNCVSDEVIDGVVVSIATDIATDIVDDDSLTIDFDQDIDQNELRSETNITIASVHLPTLSSDAGFQKYLNEINAIPSLTKEEEFLLAKNYLERHDLAAAQKLVASHLKLVVKIALQYRNYGLPVMDLVSEGSLGLMQAVKKFDPDMGNRLSTYAMWWIKASIQEYVLKSWSLVKIGTTAAQKKLFFSLGKIKRKIRNTHGRDVNHDDYTQIASDLGVSVKEIEDMSGRLSGPDMSLNNLVKEDDSSGDEMIDFLPEDSPGHDLVIMNNELLANKKKILFEAIGILNEREAKILCARKLTDNPSTLDSLSIEYNISKERVRQIENRAFEKIQAHVLARISDDGQIYDKNII